MRRGIAARVNFSKQGIPGYVHPFRSTGIRCHSPLLRRSIYFFRLGGHCVVLLQQTALRVVETRIFNSVLELLAMDLRVMLPLHIIEGVQTRGPLEHSK